MTATAAACVIYRYILFFGFIHYSLLIFVRTRRQTDERYVTLVKCPLDKVRRLKTNANDVPPFSVFFLFLISTAWFFCIVSSASISSKRWPLRMGYRNVLKNRSFPRDELPSSRCRTAPRLDAASMHFHNLFSGETPWERFQKQSVEETDASFADLITPRSLESEGGWGERSRNFSPRFDPV